MMVDPLIKVKRIRWCGLLPAPGRLEETRHSSMWTFERVGLSRGSFGGSTWVANTILPQIRRI